MSEPVCSWCGQVAKAASRCSCGHTICSGRCLVAHKTCFHLPSVIIKVLFFLAAIGFLWFLLANS